MGAGKDESKPKEIDVYKISIKWYPDFDRFEIASNTRNKGVREGILTKALERL